MQLITNRIRTGSGKKFEDLVKELTQSKIEKKAESKEVVKTAAEEPKKESKDEAASSGQLDVEPLHQKGESTEMPKKGPSAKKETCATEEAPVAKEAKKEEKEAPSSGQPEAEAKLTNDPKAPSKEEKAGEAKAETKEAGFMCDKCNKPQFACKCEKGDEKKEDEKDCSAESKVEEKKAEEKKQFVKIANLDAKNKSFLRKYWKQLFGDEYVNALLADK